MKTFPLAERRDGRAIAFEISNAYVSRRTIVELLKHANEVTDVKYAGWFGSSNDIRITFKYFGRDYIVWEPFGDNSRYWIGPERVEENVPEIRRLERVFKQHKPSFLRTLLGDVLTFWSRSS